MNETGICRQLKCGFGTKTVIIECEFNTKAFPTGCYAYMYALYNTKGEKRYCCKYCIFSSDREIETSILNFISKEELDRIRKTYQR